MYIIDYVACYMRCSIHNMPCYGYKRCVAITDSLVMGVSTKLHSRIGSGVTSHQIISNHVLDVEIDICDIKWKARRWD